MWPRWVWKGFLEEETVSLEKVYIVSDIQGDRDMGCHRVCKDTLWSWSLDVDGMMDIRVCLTVTGVLRTPGTKGHTSLALLLHSLLHRP